MAESKLRDLSMDFSVKVIRMCDNMKGHHSLVNQGLFVFFGVKSISLSPLHLFPDLLDLNLRLAIEKCIEIFSIV